MAKLPGEIQYARTLPPGRAPVVPADLDVRTGEAEIARELAGFGAELFRSGLRIQDAQKAMEISTFKRKEREYRLGALKALRAPGFDVNNDDAVAAIREKADADRDALVSKWQSVNDTYQMYRDQVEPQWEVDFEGAVQNIKAGNVRDEFRLNAENLLGQGRLLEYQTLLEEALQTGVIYKTEYDFRTKNAPNDSVLQQMRIHLGNNNPQAAILAADVLANPTIDQLEYRNKLLRMAGQQAAQNTDEIQNEITFAMFENRDKTLIERESLGNQYMGMLRATPGLSAESARVMTSRMQDWMEGKERPHNSMVYIKLVKDIERLKTGVGDPATIRRKIINSYPQLDDQHFESLIKMFEADVPSYQADEVAKILRYAEKQLVTIDEPTWAQFIAIAKGKELEEATSKRQLEYWHLSEFDKELRDWIAKEMAAGKEPTRDGIYIQFRKLLAHYRKRTIPQIELLMREREAAVLTMEERAIEAEAALIRENRIKVRSPDGKLYTIPEAQKEEAVNQGYIIVE